jgi:Polyketide cyclase / dehydrase and lipid transport
VTARQDDGMTDVVATAERIVRAPADRTLAALADYEDVRPRLVTEKFLDYRVEAGGQGAGTRVAWRFAATKSRVREQVMTVTQPTDDTLVETDENSTLTTTWTVHPTDAGLTTVRVRTSWDGAGGIGGFFERTFAPPGLRKVYDRMLERLDAIVGTG